MSWLFRVNVSSPYLVVLCLKAQWRWPFVGCESPAAAEGSSISFYAITMEWHHHHKSSLTGLVFSEKGQQQKPSLPMFFSKEEILGQVGAFFWREELSGGSKSVFLCSVSLSSFSDKSAKYILTWPYFPWPITTEHQEEKRLRLLKPQFDGKECELRHTRVNH